MINSRKIYAVNHDIGGALAMIPALKALQKEFTVLAIAWPESPAAGAFKQAGFENPLFGAAKDDWKKNILHLCYNEFTRPNLILLGISTTDEGPESLLLRHRHEFSDIPTVFIYETWPHGWLNRVEKRELYKLADRILVFDDLSRDEFIRNGFDSRKLTVTGNPANDDLAHMASRSAEIRKEMREKLSVSSSDTVLLYCTTNQDAPENNGTDSSHPRFLGFSEKEVIELFLSVGSVAQLNNSPVHLWLRLHPAQSREDTQNLIESSGAKATIIGKEWPDGRPLLLAADVVFGTVTMMLQLAAFLGRPAFSCLPNLNREDPIFSNKIGVTTPIYRKVDIARLILNGIIPKQRIGNKNNLYQLIPQATQNVCQVLRKMIL